jgi:hypothetical protein
MGRPSIWELPPFSLTPPYFGPVVPGVPIEGPSTFGNNILSVTPTTHPNDFEPVKGTKAKRHKTTGEIWYPDLFHGDHWEVYKNKKDFEKGKRDRAVWNDGRLKQKF